MPKQTEPDPSMTHIDLESQKSQLLHSVNYYYQLPDCVILHELGLWGTHFRWKLKTPDGKLIFLKEKPYYLYSDEFKFLLCLHFHIQRRKGPVASLLISATGELSFSWEGREFAVQEWVTGRHLSPLQPNDLTELGDLIGQFQLVALDFESAYAGNWSFPRNRHFTCPESWSEILEYTKYIDCALARLDRQKVTTLLWIQEWVRRHGTLRRYRITQTLSFRQQMT